MSEERAQPFPRLFDAGFRIFFLLASGYVLAATGAWLFTFVGVMPTPGTWPGPIVHGHEMIFGFVAAAIAGFLLTAVPVWTGTEPLRGAALAGLAAIWLVGRLSVWAATAVPAAAVALLDLLFLPVLAVCVARPILSARSYRNLPIVALLAVLALANLLIHLEIVGVTRSTGRPALRFAVYVVVALITIISGRIVPLFTANALRKRGRLLERRSLRGLEPLLGIVMTAVVALDVLAARSVAVSVAALATCVLLVLRQWQWRPLTTRGQPILWILHVGHAWLAVGFACIALAGLTLLFPAAAALHALTSGALGTMVLALMSRVPLGHLGRPLEASRPIVIAYFLVVAGGVVRVFGPLLGPGVYSDTVLVAGSLWALGYLLFCASFWPILTGPRQRDFGLE